MKADVYVHEFTESQALAKGACAICGVQFQSALADRIQIAANVRPCNFDSRLLARGAPGKGAAPSCLQRLDKSPIAKVASSECDFGRRMLQEENVPPRELVKQMRQALFPRLDQQPGSLCLDRAHKMSNVQS